MSSAAVPRSGDDLVAHVPWTVTAGGRLVVVLAHTALLALTGAVAWPAVGAALVLLSLLPQHRRALLAVATIGVVLASPPVDVAALSERAIFHGAESFVAAWPVVVAAVLAFGCGFVELVRRRPDLLVSRRPVAALLGLLVSLLALAGSGVVSGAVWFAATAFSMGLSSYVWFFAYATSEAKLRGAPPAIRQLGYWRPFWGFSNVPMGKGAAYLERVEARDARSLAATQLRGLRLMAWCAVLFLAMDAFRYCVYAPHGIAWLPPGGVPPIARVLEAQAAGAPLPFATRWAAVLAEFVLGVLHMTTWGNSIVATCRVAGFDIALNTDRPLLSTSIAEFYNRYYFYFKELLAAFFFYPTYLTYFRSQPKWRLFAATVMAAGVGNFVFHFLRDSQLVYDLGVVGALWAYRSYAVYAFLLGTAIAVSQVRLIARGRRRPSGARRVLATVVVVSFYCLLGVLDVRTPFDLSVYAGVYASLLVP